MRGKSLALLILALGCGLVASIGITQVMSKRHGRTALPAGETETVFVAMEDIGLGDPLTSQMLRLEQWPKDKVPSGALTNIEDVEGRRTKTKLYAGEPILANKLFSKGDKLGGVTPRIPKGYRVVSVKVDPVSSGGSLIRPGDRVDVLVHLRCNQRAGITETSTQTILQDVKVFAVNDVVEINPERDGVKPLAAKTISLLVVPQDAEKVMLASQLGKIQLVMRGPEDDEHVATDGTPTYELFGGARPTSREDEKSASQGDGFLKFLTKSKTAMNVKTTVPKLQPGRHEMRLMIGPEVNLLVLEAEDVASAPGGGFWKVNVVDEDDMYDAPTGDTLPMHEPDDQVEPEEEEEED